MAGESSAQKSQSSSCPFSIKFLKRTMMVGGAINIALAAIAYLAYQQFLRRDPSAVVYTKLGGVIGTIEVSRDGNTFSQYLGIPYAQPPIGKLRFEPPEPAKSWQWQGVLPARSYKPSCLQLEHFATGFIMGKEDCLYLNVFVSHLGRTKGKPVLVYIHGGIFHIGGAEYAGPKYFMDEDVIFITINYRLGVFGFLSTGDDVISGNMGLKDQNLALKWIQENIEHFGGDPKKVTIFGESAGGASVHHHLLSPASKGLFYKAIHQSGSSINYWAVYRNVKKQAERFAMKFECPVTTSREIANCLKGLDAKKIVGAHKELMDFYRPQISTFVPTIEVASAKSPFMTEEPQKILEEGRFPRIQLMTGVNAQEGQLISKGLIASQYKLNEANNNWENWAPSVLHYPNSRTDATEKLRDFYFGGEKYINDARLNQTFTDLFGDRLFCVPGAVAAQLEAKHTRTYLYYYDYSGVHNAGDLLASAEEGYFPNWINICLFLFKQSVINFLNIHPKKGNGNACHSDETAMLFNRDFVHYIGPSNPDYKMSKDLVHLWTSFASDDPILRFRNVEWHPVIPSPDGLKYLRISDEPSVIDEPFHKRRVFWQSLNLPNL